MFSVYLSDEVKAPSPYAGVYYFVEGKYSSKEQAILACLQKGVYALARNRLLAEKGSERNLEVNWKVTSEDIGD